MGNKVKVRILKDGFIPGIGRGPIWNPIYLSNEKYNQLKSLGFEMEIVNDFRPMETEVEETKVEVETPVVETKPEVEIKEIEKEIIKKEKEKVINEATETVVADTDEEVEVIEIIENDPDISADSYYTEDFLKSKNICKKILAERKVQYKNDDSFKNLINRVLETNPEVEFED